MTVKTVTIRPLELTDLFAWIDLYAGYAEFYDSPLTDDRAMRVWTWLHSTDHQSRGLVAVDDDGKLVGLAHVREFERLLENDRGIYLEDLFVAPDSRGQGVARALIDQLKQEAREGGFGVVRWITAADNETAMRLYDAVAEKTSWVTYDLSVG